VTPSIVLRRLDQLLHFLFGQVLTLPVFGISFAPWRRNCALFVGWAGDFQVPNCLHIQPRPQQTLYKKTFYTEFSSEPASFH
jgi:hypothetical protein